MQDFSQETDLPYPGGIRNTALKDEILRLAAEVERSSEHPLATAIVEGAKARTISLPEVANFKAVPGHGIEADVEGKHVLLGNAKLLVKYQVPLGRLEGEARHLADDAHTLAISFIGLNSNLVCWKPAALPHSPVTY